MDEATASVDFATDEAIQRAIRSEFKSSTLLTIAHRLSSVIDYDRLLVLSDGKVAEFDTPIVSCQMLASPLPWRLIAEPSATRWLAIQEPVREVWKVQGALPRGAKEGIGRGRGRRGRRNGRLGRR